MSKIEFDFSTLSAEGCKSVASPPGLVRGFKKNYGGGNARRESQIANKAESIERTAKAIAFAPGKQLFMTGFMLWMSGSTVHIFSMMFTLMALQRPLTAIVNINKAFKRIDDGTVDLLKWKLAFIGVNLVGLAMALYKCHVLGLIPLKSSDWVHLLSIKESDHITGGGVGL